MQSEGVRCTEAMLRSSFENASDGRIRGEMAPSPGWAWPSFSAMAMNWLYLTSKVERHVLVDVLHQRFEGHGRGRLLFVDDRVDLLQQVGFSMVSRSPFLRMPRRLEEVLKALHRIALGPGIDFFVRAILRGIVRAGMAEHAIGLQNHERRPVAGPGAIHRAADRVRAGEHVVAVHSRRPGIP